MTRAAEPVRADFECREPRCRVCRNEAVRLAVNNLLDWRGVPIFREGGKAHSITYADILRSLEPINEGRHERDQITYNSLWIHAKRHYDIAGVAAYWAARIPKDLVKALAG